MTGTGPSTAGGLWSESLAAYNRRDNQRSLEAVRQLLAREPDNPLYRRHEAAVLFAAGDFAGAAASAERFLRTAPEPSQVCPLLANAYRPLGDRARFVDALRRCEALNPHDVEIAFNLAQGLEETGDLKGARALGRRRRRLDRRAFGPCPRIPWISSGRSRLTEGRSSPFPPSGPGPSSRMGRSRRPSLRSTRSSASSRKKATGSWSRLTS
ncbi:MAG: hypothetical protein FD126_1241 [Elusimicrobia bacterium]|nr:MAG: hypothetical protein FD126_1241 [Elusimicrobiota bacterium]